ncbi:MAG: hypothetical protein KJ799_11610 [Bacteroidetes bacterium]|nr:hypothetical protein [Bacteroidota bacterium]
MNEMLGNQYFMARNYPAAEIELEKSLEKFPAHKGIRRKLIVCYTQTGKVRNALQAFLSLAKEDIDFIINADPIEDDCPCPELVEKMNSLEPQLDSLDREIVAGILWLYCDIEKSLQHFDNAVKFNNDDPTVHAAVKLISSKLKSISSNQVL